MIIVKPDANNDKNEIKTLNCENDNKKAGFVRFRQNGYIIDIVELSPAPEKAEMVTGETYAVLDTIIRALASYAFNRSCFYVESSYEPIFPALSRLRFSLEDGRMKSDLRLLLISCGPDSAKA